MNYATGDRGLAYQVAMILPLCENMVVMFLEMYHTCVLDIF